MKTAKTLRTIVALTMTLFFSFAAHSAETTNTKEMTIGEVKKIDKEAGKITLKHEYIKNLDMPGMTMVFQVIDKSLLDKVKVGDKIKFNADKQQGKFLVIDIQLMTGASIVKVDADKSRVVLQHQRIKSIDMEAMTMPFKVAEGVDLTSFKAGDQVRFTVVERNDHLVIDALERVE